MAILALIVTPLVMNIIRKARIAADKRSIDAYGRSIELAIAGYLLDTGTFPTSVDQLTIEYSGNKVECSTTQLNDDSSVYLTGCTVAGRTVDYAYGSDKSPTYTAYNVGDKITYNGVDYRVIKASGAKESTVALLKAEPLSVQEVNTYGGVGTANNHVNMYVCDSSDSRCYQTAYDNNGYGGMAYYSSVNCGYGTGSNNTDSGCTTSYAQSEVKYVVDAWKADKAPAASESRLLIIDELTNNLGYEYYEPNPTSKKYITTNTTPNWVYNSNYSYWIMNVNDDSTSDMRVVTNEGGANITSVHAYFFAVRPIIVLSKSLISNE